MNCIIAETDLYQRLDKTYDRCCKFRVLLTEQCSGQLHCKARFAYLFCFRPTAGAPFNVYMEVLSQEKRYLPDVNHHSCELGVGGCFSCVER